MPGSGLALVRVVSNARLAVRADFWVGVVEAALASEAAVQWAFLTRRAAVFESAFPTGFVQQHHLIHGFATGDRGVECTHDGLLCTVRLPTCVLSRAVTYFTNHSISI